MFLQTTILLAAVLACPALTTAQEATAQEATAQEAIAQEAPDAEQRRIRQIRLYIADVYTEEQAAESSWANFTNRFHITTRESVVRTQLLFKEGDIVDEELLEASERSLRGFQFLNSAEVKAVPVDEHTVDVEVRTRDAWSLTPGLDIKGGGGLSTVSVHLMELNLLGRGKKLFVEATEESDVGTTWKTGYSDYQLFGSRWRGVLKYSNGPLIESYYAQARLPLYSPDSKWSYGMSAYTADSIIRRFEDGEESSRFASDQVQAGAYLKRAFGPRYQKTNVKLTLNYKKVDYSELGAETTEPIPPDQANVTPSVTIDKENVEWKKLTYMNKMGITEDNWLGTRYGGTLGYGIPVEDGFELWDTRLFTKYNTTFTNKRLLKLKADINSEVVRNTIVLAAARYYRKFSGHTVATRLATKLGYDLDETRQFTLGGNSGLRGYPARQFTGEKLILMNLEDRQFWGNYTIGVPIDLGTVVFVDAGNAWKEEEDADLSELNWSTGFGFRIGFSNMPKQPIFRLDFGWAIDSESEDNFAVTFGQEQQF
mgnify:FL=1